MLVFFIALKLKLILLTVNRVTNSFRFLKLVIFHFQERLSKVLGIKMLNISIKTVKTLKGKL